MVDMLVAWLKTNPNIRLDGVGHLISDKYNAGDEERKTYKLAA